MLSVASKSAFTEGVTAFKVVLLDLRFGGNLENSEDILGGLSDLRGWRDLLICLRRYLTLIEN
jgi:hypothetical protein